jgi:hypothetical protein
MTVVRHTRKFVDEFDRDIAFTAGTANGYWTIKDTSSSGTPTYTTVTANDGGLLTITLASTNEAEVVTLYQTDKLFYDLAYLQHVWWVLKVASISAVTTLVAGVGAAQNDTADDVVTNAWFRMEGSASTSALVVETDDGNAASDNDDVATGQTLSTTLKKLHIDFTNGLGDVRFYVDGARVAASTTFSMAGLTAGLNVQPFLQIQKSGGTTTPAVSIAQFGIQYQYAYGA